MDVETPATAPGDLGALFVRLREAGFRVDTRQYLTAADLLMALAGQGVDLQRDTAVVIRHLAPIFCTSPEEQATFPDLFAPTPARQTTTTDPTARRPPSPWWTLLLGLLGLCSVGLVVWTIYWHHPVPSPVDEKDSPDGSPRPDGGTSAFTFGEPTVTFKPALPEPVTALERSVDWRRVIGWSAGVGGLVLGLWGLGALVIRRRRQLALQRMGDDGGGELARLPGQVSTSDLLAEGALRRATTALRRARFEAVEDFDVPRSIEAAVQGRGSALPRFTPRRTVPEYVAFVERLSADDHQARLYDEVLDRLEALGLTIERYSFAGDPRACFRRGQAQHPRTLTEVLSRHHRAAAMLFMDAGRCFNPLTGRPHPWLEVLDGTARRALLTATPAYSWGWPERALAARGFFVAVAGEDALAAFGEAEGPREDLGAGARGGPAYARPYPPLLLTEPWLATDREEPAGEIVTRLVGQLRSYLPPRAYAWLAACAAYPEVTWELTLHLSEVIWKTTKGPPGNDGLRAHLSALARLPWFRLGWMPAWLRTAMLTQLTETQEQAVRASLSARLAALVDRAVRHGASDLTDETSMLRLRAFVSDADYARTRPPGAPLRDAVFLGYLQGRRLPATALAAPTALRSLFGRVGLMSPSSGMKAAPRSLRHEVATTARGWRAAGPVIGAVALTLASALGSGVALSGKLMHEERGTPPLRVFELAFTRSGFVTTAGNLVELWNAKGEKTRTFQVPWAVRRFRVSEKGDLISVAFRPGEAAASHPLEGTFDIELPLAIPDLKAANSPGRPVSSSDAQFLNILDLAPDAGITLREVGHSVAFEQRSKTTRLLKTRDVVRGARLNAKTDAIVWEDAGVYVFGSSDQPVATLEASPGQTVLGAMLDRSSTRAVLTTKKSPDSFTVWAFDVASQKASRLVDDKRALSAFIDPDGTEVAVFDGQQVRVYVLQEAPRIVVVPPIASARVSSSAPNPRVVSQTAAAPRQRAAVQRAPAPRAEDDPLALLAGGSAPVEQVKQADPRTEAAAAPPPRPEPVLTRVKVLSGSDLGSQVETAKRFAATQVERCVTKELVPLRVARGTLIFRTSWLAPAPVRAANEPMPTPKLAIDSVKAERLSDEATRRMGICLSAAGDTQISGSSTAHVFVSVEFQVGGQTAE